MRTNLTLAKACSVSLLLACAHGAGVAPAHLAAEARGGDAPTSSRTARQARAEAYRRSGELQSALEVLRQLVDDAPGDVATREKLVDVLLEAELDDEALDHLREIVATKPSDLWRKYQLARLCHWRMCWRTSQQLYHEILAVNPAYSDTLRLSEDLATQRGAALYTEVWAQRDSASFARVGGRSEFSYPMNERLIVGVSYGHQQVFEPVAAIVRDLPVDKYTARVSLKPRPEVGFDAEAGAEGVFGRFVRPTGTATVYFSLLGFLYPSFSWWSGLQLASLRSVEERLGLQTLSASVFANPGRYVDVSGTITRRFVSDDNRGIAAQAGVWLTPRVDRFGLKLGGAVYYEDYETIVPYPAAYYTANEAVTLAPGGSLTWDWADKLYVEAGYDATVYAGKIVSHNPRGLVRWNIQRSDRLEIEYRRSAFGEYRFDYLRVSFNHRY